MVTPEDIRVLRATRVLPTDFATRLREFANAELGTDAVESLMTIGVVGGAGNTSKRYLMRHGPCSADYGRWGDNVMAVTAGTRVRADIDEQVQEYEDMVVCFVTITRITCDTVYSGWNAVARAALTADFKRELVEKAWHPSRLACCLDTEDATAVGLLGNPSDP